MAMAMIPVISPPVRNEIHFGKALAKSFAGDTTFAAMLTDSVATTTVNMEMATTTGALNCPTSLTGSHRSLIGRSREMATAAEVMITPIPAETHIVVGRATARPVDCSPWVGPQTVEPGMLSDKVAQKS